MTDPRWRLEEYLRWVAAQPCASCGREGEVQAHHIKGRGQMSGVSLKAPDWATMPLCCGCHVRLHAGNRAMLDKQWEWVARTLGLFLEEMTEGLGMQAIRTLVKGVTRSGVIGGHL